MAYRHLVIDPLHAPDEQGTSPYLTLFLACLPALDMGTEVNARRVLTAIRDTGAAHANRKRLTTIFLKKASDATRQLLEALMVTDEWKDDFVESYIDQGRAKGAAETKAQDVLTALDVRDVKPTKEQLGPLNCGG